MEQGIISGFDLLMLQGQTRWKVSYLNHSPQWCQAICTWIFDFFFVSVLKLAHTYITLGGVIRCFRESIRSVMTSLACSVCILDFGWRQTLEGSKSWWSSTLLRATWKGLVKAHQRKPVRNKPRASRAHPEDKGQSSCRCLCIKTFFGVSGRDSF